VSPRYHGPVLRTLGPLVALVIACGSSTTPTPDTKSKSILEPRGIEEMKRVKQDVEKAHEDGLKRTDDAMDRAEKAEAVGRGAPGR
jgi:hypothetical protein